MASIDAPASHISPTGVIFSSSRNVPTLANKDSANSSASASINEAEKAETWDDEKALARYLVPALEKGQKNARLKPPTLWIRFRVWYNPYRMVRRFTF